MENNKLCSSLPSKRITLNPDELNNHFAPTAERTLNRHATSVEDIFTAISNLPPDKENYCSLTQRSPKRT